MTYSVTYDGNGNDSGTVPTDATAYNTSDVVHLKQNSGGLTSPAGTFLGWCASATLGSTLYQPNDTTLIMGSSNITLYAIYSSDAWLKGYWQFNENTGTTAADTTKHRNATVSSGAWSSSGLLGAGFQ